MATNGRTTVIQVPSVLPEIRAYFNSILKVSEAKLSVTRVGTSQTRWNNFVVFCRETKRDPETVKAYLLERLEGGQGSIDTNGNLMLNRRVTAKTISVQLHNYDLHCIGQHLEKRIEEERQPK